MPDKKKVDLSDKKQRLKYWTDHAKDNLVGKTIKNVRYMTPKEAEDQLMWYSQCLVIEFTDGTLIFPSSDDEGNDAGVLFGQNPKGKSLTFPVLRD